jgi:flagellar biosynthetic protein FliQ
VNESDVIALGQQALTVALSVSLPVLLFGLIAGVLVSIFQAVTQIQEMTLTFVPKMLAVALALLLFGSWMLNQLVGFTQRAFTHAAPLFGR